MDDAKRMEYLGKVLAVAREAMDTGITCKVSFDAALDMFVLKVEGFYKHSEITLIGSDTDAVSVIGRYGDLDIIYNPKDLAALNYYEWQKWEARGFTLNEQWAPLLEKHGYIKKVIKTQYEAVR